MGYNAADLSTDGHAGNGLNGSCSSDAGMDILTLYLGGLERYFLFFLTARQQPDEQNYYCNGADGNPNLLVLHICFCFLNF